MRFFPKSTEKRMVVTCHVIVSDEKDASGGIFWARQLTFEVTPRIGEFVVFSRDGKRDENQVLHSERFTVKRVFNVAGNDRSGPMITPEVAADD